jgi:hypothetical protein
MEEWRFNDTCSGVPRGGVIKSTALNMLLDKLIRLSKHSDRHTREAVGRRISTFDWP